MDSAEEGAAARDPFGLESQGFIGATRAGVLGEHPEPHAPGVGLAEHRVDHPAEQRAAVAQPGAYPAGAGLVSGATFGRIAGRNAARAARSL